MTFIASESSLSQRLKTQISALERRLKSVQHGNPWPEEPLLSKAFTHIQETLDDDLARLERDCGFMLSPAGDIGDRTEAAIALIRSWQITGQGPSLCAMSFFAVERFCPDLAPDFVVMVAVAAVLGEVENDVTYHDVMHYKKVLLQTVQLIAVHQDIFEGTKRILSDAEIALLLAAACIHDIGHDGLGNVLKGMHIEGRTEKLSFLYARPYFEAAECVDETMLGKLYVMLLTTDVSPLDDPANPMHQMKAAYRYHFLGENARAHVLNLSEPLAVLERDAALSQLCMLLHEADIATSAGLSYAVTQYETALLWAEFGLKKARPSDVMQFLNQVCRRRMLSDAGQWLYAANLARVYARAEADAQAGDDAFPKPQHTDFILGMLEADGAGTGAPKTIN